MLETTNAMKNINEIKIKQIKDKKKMGNGGGGAEKYEGRGQKKYDGKEKTNIVAT